MAAEIVHFFFEVHINTKMYHWSTTSYARHKAADQLVDTFSGLSDKFVEVYIGKYGRPDRPTAKRNTNIPVHHYDDKSIVKYLDKCIQYLTNDLLKYIKPDDVDLINLRDEMVAVLNQTKYLFSLT